ncbi:D-beta-hydroxybutyrate dehydrogenase, mitochondrial-like [Liolophura sinensis]|uniref:D-beta-hydroxybutyrate dehydrogenase, mitochondrial-like n=1 Tax=Liolophura sinensis TaxID=3198878 RepID=UPI0031596C6A
MPSSVEFVLHQAVEIAFVTLLAFLASFVPLRAVGFTLLAIVLLICGYRMLKMALTKRVSLEGKGVFITGCDTGFGNSLARRLASLGFRVFAGCYRPDDEEAQALKASCGEALHIIPLDVSSDSSVTHAAKYVKEHLGEGGLWGVVNNAGQNVCGEAELCTMDMYKRIMDINMFGAVRVTKAFLPMIRRSKGRILNVSSVNGRVGIPRRAPYTMSKYALEGFSDVLRLEMRQWGVKVILIEPGSFGGSTAILRNSNLERIKNEVNTMWEEATVEVKEDYGKDYHFDVVSSISRAIAKAPSSFASVINAMEDALLTEDPKTRYLIGGGKGLYDNFKVSVVLRMILPDVLTDLLIDRFIWKRSLRPRLLRNQ